MHEEDYQPDRTGHLLGKTWLPSTNWDGIIRQTIEGRVG